jgi:transcriptional regulator with GAF, ATPase, and Fis domain
MRMDEAALQDELHLAETFADIARQMQRADSAEETWQAIADLAVGNLGFSHCGMTIVDQGGRFSTPAASDEVPIAVDAIQYETGEGPCIGAVRDSEKYLSVDLSRETRWPTFAQRTVETTGARSMLSLRLFVDEGTLGAMNFYDESIDAFDQRAQAVAGVLAAHAAVAMSAALGDDHVEQLEQALDSNRTIGLALGMLMEQSQVDRGRAFQMLSSASQRLNIKLRVLAERIVARHEEEVSGTATQTADHVDRQA